MLAAPLYLLRRRRLAAAGLQGRHGGTIAGMLMFPASLLPPSCQRRLQAAGDAAALGRLGGPHDGTPGGSAGGQPRRAQRQHAGGRGRGGASSGGSGCVDAAPAGSGGAVRRVSRRPGCCCRMPCSLLLQLPSAVLARLGLCRQQPALALPRAAHQDVVSSQRCHYWVQLGCGMLRQGQHGTAAPRFRLRGVELADGVELAAAGGPLRGHLSAPARSCGYSVSSAAFVDPLRSLRDAPGPARAALATPPAS